MNRDDQMKQYDNPEFWGRVIKESRKQAAPLVVKHAYKPLGMWIVISLLVLLAFLDNGVPVTISILLTMLIVLVAFIMS